MKISTLKIIEKLLMENVSKRQKACDIVSEKLERLKDERERNTEDFDEENFQYWKDTKKKHFQMLLEAENAVEDFMNHEWR